ncbi:MULTISPECIES: alpha/beta fold hydrolase [Pseudomonadaceae]|uniref:(R)-3-hydroxydecanoyl-ACP:CoA transacylase n=1 Tax=Metapseudomonas otitidis TaxID=319939 RepID=A0A679GSK1_9GAMM|nr:MULTISPECIES: alpha/beta hydrolase [Pseudomonas]MDU9398918.1 alpha/beta hydrolase [Pseudomonas sp. zfem003]WIF66436.1 alpha/beta hydrolase [Pseudomonas otitidis]BCA30439.1 (R)-3-hydroxydecanoyl-ACP:CoA transacylase [Pseudomonas otitidis]
MRPQTQVVTVNRKYKVHTEFYANPQASRTIILVNGSLATTASFAQTVKYLHPQFNVVLYDQPYAGQSKPHNDHGSPVTKEAEAEILLALIEHHQVDYVSSFSWGGVATLLALSQNPARIRKAVINSFSPVLNEPMLDYLRNGMTHLQALDRENVAQLVNATIGRYLPALFKRFNHKHVASLDDHEYLQMHFHIRQVLNLDAHCYVDCLQAVDIPLLFINGEHDLYTSPEDARGFARHVRDCQFATIRNAGHFIDLEHKAGWQQTQDVLLGFLNAPTRSQQPRVLHGLGPQAMAV